MRSSEGICLFVCLHTPAQYSGDHQGPYEYNWMRGLHVWLLSFTWLHWRPYAEFRDEKRETDLMEKRQENRLAKQKTNKKEMTERKRKKQRVMEKRKFLAQNFQKVGILFILKDAPASQ